jgi:hypothetical protein
LGTPYTKITTPKHFQSTVTRLWNNIKNKNIRQNEKDKYIHVTFINILLGKKLINTHF